MNTKAKVLEMVSTWKRQGLEKPEIIVNAANACIGWPYVFGARGEDCTPSGRRSRASPTNPDIEGKCQVLTGQRASCDGCKWFPGGVVLDFDCRGFTYWLLMLVGIKIEGKGATSQYNKAANWQERGPIAQMPKDKVCCVFRYDGKTGKYEHTLLYDGSGHYIHCSGEVKKVATAKYKATHYAIPKGLYSGGGGGSGEGAGGGGGESTVKGNLTVTAKKVALRSGPDTNCAVLERINEGETVEAVAESPEWKRVRHGNKVGYMMVKYLKEASENE